MGTAFQIVGVLGTGSFGTVAVARRAGSEGLVALKVLKLEHEDDDHVLRRTRDEARLLQKLEHPNIVRVHDLLEYAGRPVVIMEYIDGVDLERLVQERRRGLPPALALHITGTVAGALGAAWSQPTEAPLRAVHRDIQPSNVVLTVDGQVKLVDFGVARAEFAGREAVTEASVIGSPAYTAPERFLDGVRGTPAVDTYALGITLAFMLTAKTPVLPRLAVHYAGSLERQMARLAPDGADEQLRGEVVALASRMCAHDPEDRPSHAVVAEACADLAGRLAPHWDTAAFAQKAVGPLRLELHRVDPKRHPDYDAVRFLDTAAARDPEAELAALLRQEGWEARQAELEAWVGACDSWCPPALVEVLAGSRKLAFWRRPTSRQLEVALVVLSRQPSPQVVELAGRLVHHRDRPVAAAARRVVARATPPGARPR